MFVRGASPPGAPRHARSRGPRPRSARVARGAPRHARSFASQRSVTLTQPGGVMKFTWVVGLLLSASVASVTPELLEQRGSDVRPLQIFWPQLAGNPAP